MSCLKKNGMMILIGIAVFLMLHPAPTSTEDRVDLEGHNFLSWYRILRAGQANRPMFYEASMWTQNDPIMEDEAEINRLKMAMNRTLSDADIRAIKGSGVNTVRFKLSYAQFSGGIWGDPPAFHDPNIIHAWDEHNEWNLEEFERLRRMINRLGDEGIQSILTLTSVPGGMQNNVGLGCRIHTGRRCFWNPDGPYVLNGHIYDPYKWQKCTIEVWRRIAYEFGNNVYVLGYELMDEPGLDMKMADDLCDPASRDQTPIDYVVTLVCSDPANEDPASTVYKSFVFHVPEYLHRPHRKYKGYASLRLVYNTLTRAIRQIEAQQHPGEDHKWIFRPNTPGKAEDYFRVVADLFSNNPDGAFRVGIINHPNDDFRGDAYFGQCDPSDVIKSKLRTYFPNGIEIVDPINPKKTAFSPHWYRPKNFAIKELPGSGKSYPDNIGDWDKAFMETYCLITRLVSFSTLSGCPIWFGEFEARNKEQFGGDQYLADVIDVLGSRFWGWNMYCLNTHFMPDTRKWAVQDLWSENSMEYLSAPPFPDFDQSYDLGALYAGMNGWTHWGTLDHLSPDGKASFYQIPQFFGTDRSALMLGFTEDTNWTNYFSDGTLGGFALNGGDWSIIVSDDEPNDYVYQCDNNSGKTDICRFGDNAWRDIEYRGRMKFNDVGAGIIFRAVSSQTYYLMKIFDLTDDQFIFSVSIDGGSILTTPYSFTDPVDIDTWYKFRIEVTGTGEYGETNFYFGDDSLYGEYEDLPLQKGESRTVIQRGKVGFTVSPGTTATYDDLEVIPISDHVYFRDTFQRPGISGGDVTWNGSGAVNWRITTDPDDGGNFYTVNPDREDLVVEADTNGEMKSSNYDALGAGIIEARVRTPQVGSMLIGFLKNISTENKLLTAKIQTGITDPGYEPDYPEMLHLMMYKSTGDPNPESLAHVYYPFEGETWHHLRISFHRVCHLSEEGLYVRIYVDDMLHPLVEHIVMDSEILPDTFSAGPVVLEASDLGTGEKGYFDNVQAWQCDSSGAFGFSEAFTDPSTTEGYSEGNFEIVSGDWDVIDDNDEYYLRGTAEHGTGEEADLGDLLVTHAVVEIKQDDPLINDYQFSGQIYVHPPNPLHGQTFYPPEGVSIPLRTLIGFRRSNPAQQYALNFQFGKDEQDQDTFSIQLLRRGLGSTAIMPIRSGYSLLAKDKITAVMYEKWLNFFIEVKTNVDGYPDIEIHVGDNNSNECNLSFVDVATDENGKNPYGYKDLPVGNLSLEVFNMPFDFDWGTQTRVDWDDLTLTALDPCSYP